MASRGGSYFGLDCLRICSWDCQPDSYWPRVGLRRSRSGEHRPNNVDCGRLGIAPGIDDSHRGSDVLEAVSRSDGAAHVTGGDHDHGSIHQVAFRCDERRARVGSDGAGCFLYCFRISGAALCPVSQRPFGSIEGLDVRPGGGRDRGSIT